MSCGPNKEAIWKIKSFLRLNTRVGSLVWSFEQDYNVR